MEEKVWRAAGGQAILPYPERVLGMVPGDGRKVNMKKETFATLGQEAQLDALIASPIGQVLGLTEKFKAQALADQGRSKAAFRASGMALWRKEACALKDAKAYPALHRWVMLERAFFAFEAAQAAFGDGR